MTRLIDADKLRQAMDGTNEYATLCRWQILEVIDRQPAVEAVPVVHGHWVVKEKIGKLVCSNCGKRINVKREIQIKYAKEHEHFCYNCGAKMDEESVNSDETD